MSTKNMTQQKQKGTQTVLRKAGTSTPEAVTPTPEVAAPLTSELVKLLQSASFQDVETAIRQREASLRAEAEEHLAIGAAKQREADMWAGLLRAQQPAAMSQAPTATQVENGQVLHPRGGWGKSPAQDRLVEYVRKQDGREVSYEEISKALKTDENLVIQTARRTEEAFKAFQREEGVERLKGQAKVVYVRHSVERKASAG